MAKVWIEDNYLVLELSLAERILCVKPSKQIRIRLDTIIEMLPFSNVRVRYRILGLHIPGSKKYFGYFMTDHGLAFCVVRDPERAVALKVNDRRFDLVAFDPDESTLATLRRVLSQ